MELIPVFSLIVLVATIGTFILAIGAYVMFRVREYRYRGTPAQPSPTYDADVFAPQVVDPPAAESTPDGFVRRESLRDPRVMRFQRDPVDPDTTTPPGERRTWR